MTRLRMKPKAALAAIAAVLNGREWDSDTADEVATIVRLAGYAIADPPVPGDELFQAVVVVVREGDSLDAWDVVANATREIDEVQFVSEPWPVTPIAYPDSTPAGEREPMLEEPEFGGVEALRQHPDYPFHGRGTS